MREQRERSCEQNDKNTILPGIFYSSHEPRVIYIFAYSIILARHSDGESRTTRIFAEDGSGGQGTRFAQESRGDW